MLGFDPAERRRRGWRERIGVVLQSSAMYDDLRSREMLSLFARLLRAPAAVDEIVELVGLKREARTTAARLSGGQRRRLDLGTGARW